MSRVAVQGLGQLARLLGRAKGAGKSAVNAAKAGAGYVKAHPYRSVFEALNLAGIGYGLSGVFGEEEEDSLASSSIREMGISAMLDGQNPISIEQEEEALGAAFEPIGQLQQRLEGGSMTDAQRKLQELELSQMLEMHQNLLDDISQAPEAPSFMEIALSRGL